MKRRVAQKVLADATHLASQDTVPFMDYPALVQHCTVMKYDDGETREPGWITIKTKGAAWVVSVKDPDGCCGIDVIGETLDKALSDADKLISADDCPWVPDPWMSARKAKGKKSK